MKNKFYILILTGLCLATLFYVILYLNKIYDFTEFEKLYSDTEYPYILSEYEGVYKDGYILHNLGNTSYKLYESGDKEDIEYLDSAVSYFSGSLNISEHPDTRYNYELLLKEQEEREQQTEESEQQEMQGQEQQQEPSNENGSGSTSENSESSSSDAEEPGRPQISSREEQYRLDEQESIDNLTQQEKQALEETIEALKQEQMYNQRFFNKEDSSSNFDSLFDRFFDNGGNSGEEKDW